MQASHFAQRRSMLLSGAVCASAGLLPTTSYALKSQQLSAQTQALATLDAAQSRAFMQWFVRIIEAQVRSPNARWVHRDCAGLVRFAAAESLRVHDAAWVRANGMRGPFPPEVNLRADQQVLRNQWVQEDGKRGAYVSAIGLIQRNSQFNSREMNLARAGDLLFYDQGDDQHLMIWMGRTVAYHTGSSASDDNGMRAVTLDQLMQWRDTRWRPSTANPNFAGVFRFNFLTA